MKSYLQQLENNEAILLMYIAGELPEQDRAEVEQMLASDVKLQAEMENLRQTQQLAFDALESLDAMMRPPAPTIVAQNRISQLVREWIEKRRGLEALVLAPRRSLPGWRVSLATAATLMVGCYIWAVYHTGPPVPQARVLTDDDKLTLLRNSFEESNLDDSNLHVAEVASEVASAVPVDADDSTDIGNAGSDSNSTGTP